MGQKNCYNVQQECPIQLQELPSEMFSSNTNVSKMTWSGWSTIPLSMRKLNHCWLRTAYKMFSMKKCTNILTYTKVLKKKFLLFVSPPPNFTSLQSTLDPMEKKRYKKLHIQVERSPVIKPSKRKFASLQITQQYHRPLLFSAGASPAATNEIACRQNTLGKKHVVKVWRTVYSPMKIQSIQLIWADLWIQTVTNNKGHNFPYRFLLKSY